MIYQGSIFDILIKWTFYVDFDFVFSVLFVFETKQDIHSVKDVIIENI